MTRHNNSSTKTLLLQQIRNEMEKNGDDAEYERILAKMTEVASSDEEAVAIVSDCLNRGAYEHCAIDLLADYMDLSNL